MATFYANAMSKSKKLAGALIAAPFVLIILLVSLIYFPPFQNWLARHVAAYASEQTGMEISVAKVRLVFPLDLGIYGVKAFQPSDSIPEARDTVLCARRIVADVRLWPLLRGDIEVDELTLDSVRLNTLNIIHTMRLRGDIGLLTLKSHGISLKEELAKLDEAVLKNARLSIELSDTVPKDTTPSSNNWRINLDKVAISNTDFTLHMPGDTLSVRAYMGSTNIKGGLLDLGKGLYSVASIDWKNGKLNYDQNYKPRTAGLDFNHIALDKLALRADSFSYYNSKIDAKILACAFKERGGLKIDWLEGRFGIDSTSLSLPNMRLATPFTNISVSYKMDLNAFDDTLPGTLSANIKGAVGKHDIELFMPSNMTKLMRRWPQWPLKIDADVAGNMKKLRIKRLKADLPTAFNITANGFAGNLDNTSRLIASIDFDVALGRTGFLLDALSPGLTRQFNIPSGTRVSGKAGINGQNYTATITATEGGGSLKADLRLNAKRTSYAAKARANGFRLHNFLPSMNLSAFTGTIEASGIGSDFLSPSTRLNASARIKSFGFQGHSLDNIDAKASLSGGKVMAVIDSENPLLAGLINFDGTTNGRTMSGKLTCDVKKADLKALGVSGDITNAALAANVNIASNFNDYYKASGWINHVELVFGGKSYYTDGVNLDLLTSRDTTNVIVECGDFHLFADARGGYESVLHHLNSLIAEGRRQFNDRTIDQTALRERLPEASIWLVSGRDNLFCDLLRRQGYDFKDLSVNLKADRKTGLNGDVDIDSLIVDSIRLDTVRLALVSDTLGTRYNARVCNAKGNPTYVFKALLDGSVEGNGTDAALKIYDADNRLGLALGVRGDVEKGGIRFHMHDDNPVLGYKAFDVNDSNYVFLGNDQRVSANLSLKANDGMGVQIYSDDDNTEALQDLTFSLNKFDLERVLSVIPYTPDIAGVMNGDYHLVQTPSELTVSADMTVTGMAYEKCPMGDMGAQFVYMPKSDGSHYVDGILLQNDKEVGTLTGTYSSEGVGSLDAKLKLEHLPMQLANGFIPDRLFGLHGYGDGELSVKGSLQSPQVDGEVYLDSCYLYSEPYGLQMRFADDPVRIVGSKLLFENFEMFANNDQPLDISGSLDFSRLDRMTMDVRMRAQNFLLIDAKENPRSEAYGKAYINFLGALTGPVESLRMRGRVDVLGNTDMTYVMRDSELSADTQLDELVKFTNFNDTTTVVEVERPQLKGFDMALSVNIDEGAHIACMLNADHTNYIDQQGGGDLMLTYNPADDLRLTGKYTLTSGTMKYSLPIIPLKTFTIQDGSYLEFQGDATNPTLHITATERVKATVGEGSGQGRMVEFDCGVKLSQTLNNLGLEFIIDAPNDMSISDELNTMTKEGRSKVAITMLASGMYLSDGNTKGFSMNSALSSFLQTEINNVAGSAMRSLGLDIGMSVDNATTSSGASHTDYNFSFAKRLWNNRLSIIVGGQVSTGAELDYGRTNDAFFNNVELEYRLDSKSSKYLRLFYDNNKYDWLEGPLGEYGIGFKWQRKLRHFKDIFRLKNEEEANPARSDSTKARKDEEK